jgi:prepilin-type N-terminal cleavage/methylation domain-containing protein
MKFNPLTQPRAAFTLVELLVVITLIAVMIAMFMPALREAREAARRARCSINLHNIYLGAMAYSADFQGDAPYQWLPGSASNPPTGWDASLATEEAQYTSTTGGNPSTKSDTGWKTFVLQRYFTTALLTCPSQNNKISLDSNAPGIHYGYRYNSRRAMAYNDSTLLHPNGANDEVRPPRHLLYGEAIRGNGDTHDRQWRGLFSDAANGRRDGLYQIAPRDTSYNVRQWAHQVGGHIVTHRGDIKWLTNKEPTPGQQAYYPGWPRNWYVWYGDAWTRGVDAYLQQW